MVSDTKTSVGLFIAGFIVTVNLWAKETPARVDFTGPDAPSHYLPAGPGVAQEMLDHPTIPWDHAVVASPQGAETIDSSLNNLNKTQILRAKFDAAGNSNDRASMVSQLAGQNNPIAIDGLLQATTDRDPKVRQAAAVDFAFTDLSQSGLAGGRLDFAQQQQRTLRAQVMNDPQALGKRSAADWVQDAQQLAARKARFINLVRNYLRAIVKKYPDKLNINVETLPIGWSEGDNTGCRASSSEVLAEVLFCKDGQNGKDYEKIVFSQADWLKPQADWTLELQMVTLHEFYHANADPPDVSYSAITNTMRGMLKNMRTRQMLVTNARNAGQDSRPYEEHFSHVAGDPAPPGMPQDLYSKTLEEKVIRALNGIGEEHAYAFAISNFDDYFAIQPENAKRLQEIRAQHLQRRNSASLQKNYYIGAMSNQQQADFKQLTASYLE